jgi:hypothetical protein
MSDHIEHVLQVFPPRPLSDGERQILLDWIGVAEAFSAFFSARRDDPPEMYNRIVVSHRLTNRPLYFIHCSTDSGSWLMVSSNEGEGLGHFRTLRAALRDITHRSRV